MSDVGAAGPYGRAAWVYRRAGWAGVIPLPPGRKDPPPGGYTGWAGVEPSGADIQAWLDGPEAAGNVALHLGAGLYGLDVDAYGGKDGAGALARLIEAHGPLPPTWVVTARTDGVSGIRLYRAEMLPGRVWVDEPAGRGAGIEAIHRGHRYAVAPPSIHPDTAQPYRWLWWDGAPASAPGGMPEAVELPTPATLPELPAAWVEALSRPGEVRTGDAAGHDESVRTVTGWREGDTCPRVAEAASRALGGLRAARDGAALHPVATAGLWELVSLGHEGHAGVRRALAEHYAAHVEVRAGRGDRRGEGEWWRLVRGAVGKLDPATAREHCDCDLLRGVGVTFTPAELGPWAPAATSGDGVGPVSAETSPAAPLPLDADPAVSALRARLLTPGQVIARQPPAPLLSGLLYRDSLAWLIGKSGSFKSFIAVDIAAHVAGGVAWAGRRVWGGPVVYMAAEGAGGMTLRLRAWVAKYGSMSDEMMMLPGAVQVNGEHWPAFIELCRGVGPALVVVDTQARVSVGVRENDNGEMGALIDRLDALRRATGACVLTVHHIGRQGTDARGASAIDAAQDTELRAERAAGGVMRVALTVDKQKDGPDAGAIALDLETVELGADPATGEPLSSLVVVPDLIGDPFPAAPWREGLPENQAAIMRILHDHFSESGGTRAEVAAVLKEQGQRGDVKYRRSTFYDAWNALMKKDMLERIPGTQRFVIADTADPAASIGFTGIEAS